MKIKLEIEEKFEWQMEMLRVDRCFPATLTAEKLADYLELEAGDCLLYGDSNENSYR